ncbi:MAG: tRNA-binding protein [Saprospiraceae bacterium]|nr:tRNA-binding protein [Saprospiraceae bacterium]
MIRYEDFEKVEMRIGTIRKVEDFPLARNPSYKLEIDFGEIGIKRCSAQITVLYSKEELIGRQIVAVVNFPIKQIANFNSECLLLGAVGQESIITLLHPERPVENGLRVL